MFEDSVSQPWIRVRTIGMGTTFPQIFENCLQVVRCIILIGGLGYVPPSPTPVKPVAEGPGKIRP